jgi:hypothetical protein
MKKLLFVLLAGVLISCGPDAGTLQSVDQGNNPEIEVFKYYYTEGGYVYVARFKDSRQVVTTTWSNFNPATKTHDIHGNVIIYENDSVQVVLKSPAK